MLGFRSRFDVFGSATVATVYSSAVGSQTDDNANEEPVEFRKFNVLCKQKPMGEAILPTGSPLMTLYKFGLFTLSAIPSLGMIYGNGLLDHSLSLLEISRYPRRVSLRCHRFLA